MNVSPVKFLGLSALCILLLLGLQQALRPNTQVRNYRFLPEMVESVAAESQGVFAALPGGLTEQALVPGVVVRGALPFRYEQGQEEEERAGRELQNPFTDTLEVLARGAEVFRIYCSVCHGLDGLGRGPVVLRGLPPPTSLLGVSAMEMKDGRMFHVVTLGRNNMASYAAQVSAEDRWRVIRYVRKLQEGAQ